MHIHALDSYQSGDSFVHHLDPRVKLLLALLLIVTAALLPDGSWAALGMLEALLLLVVLLSRVGLGLVQRRAAIAVPFALAALTVIFSTPGAVLLSLPLPGGAWAITDTGLVRFASVVARS